ncbi:MAG: nucleotidyltransferase family protein [Bacteroidota bacterium]
MSNFKRHLIDSECKIIDALDKLDKLAADAILFVINKEGKLLGALTDGDVRRGLLKGLKVEDKVTDFIQRNPRFVRKDNFQLEDIIKFREGHFKIIPVLDEADRIINIINFRLQKSYLPVDAVIMAGGRGQRLRPLTDDTPKPMLKVGDKPIIEHNIDRLISYGIDDVHISLRYLGDHIKSYFKDGLHKGANIQYVNEDDPLGTIGSISLIEKFRHETVLITNSDLLTNLDYEDFYRTFIESGADFSVVTIPYEVKIPYAVIETSNEHVVSFREKPTYTYFSNGGIYLTKRKILDLIPKKSFYNATDLMERLIKEGMKVHSYPLRGYWLDIGRHEDYEKAQEDIKHLKF